MPRNSSRDMEAASSSASHHRFAHAGYGQGHRARHVRPVLNVHVPRFVELLGDFARHLHYEGRRVEPTDAADAADPVTGGLPKLLAADAIGANGANSCDRYTTCQLCFAFVPLASIG